jgi:hypothetical protein
MGAFPGAGMKGKQPEDLRSDAKACAERMGYHWAENTDPTLPFDGLMYRETVMVVLKCSVCQTDDPHFRLEWK